MKGGYTWYALLIAIGLLIFVSWKLYGSSS